MRLPKLNKTEQILLYVLVLATLGSLLYRLAIFPELRRIKTARSQLTFRQELVNMEEREIQQRDALINTVRQLETAMGETRKLLFSRDEAVDFLRALPQLTDQTGGVLTSMNSYEMENLSSTCDVAQDSRRILMAMPVQVAVRGNYGEIIRFLEQLRERRQLITASKIRVRNAGDPAEVNAEFTLNLYVYEYQET